MKTMFNKIKPYMGGYIRYTYAALAVIFIAEGMSRYVFYVMGA